MHIQHDQWMACHEDCVKLKGCHRMLKFGIPVCREACARKEW